ncbi:MAG: hypothetical protein E4H44_04315, partial [Candidatus Aminicenantes bacterium]
MNTGLDYLRFKTAALVVLLAVGASTVVATDEVVAVRIPERRAGAVETVLSSPILHVDYGSFGWWLLNPADAAALNAAGIDHQIVEEPYILTLGEERFDLLSGEPVQPPGWNSPGRQGPDLHLIQGVAPIRSSWLGDLRARGLDPVQYIHPFTYVLWGSRHEIEAAAALPWVRSHADFAPGFRVLPRWRQPDQPLVDVEILIPTVADPPTLITALVSLGATRVHAAPLEARWTVVSLTLPAETLASAAAVPGVYSIQPAPVDGGARGEMSNQVCADNIDQSNMAYPGYQG